MPTQDSNIDIVDYISETKMFPITEISYFAWDNGKGARLKALRGSISRDSLAKKLKTSSPGASKQYIQKLEDGRAESVSREILQNICAAIGCDISNVIPSVVLSIQK